MTSNFTNINVSGDATIYRVIADEVLTNYLNINTTDIGVSGMGKFTNLVPYSGNAITLNSGNSISMNTSNIFLSGNNIITSANILAPFNGNIQIVNLRAYNETDVAYTNVNNKIVLVNSSNVSSAIQFYNNSNLSTERINASITCSGFGGNASVQNRGNLNLTAGNIVLNGNTVCNSNVFIDTLNVGNIYQTYTLNKPIDSTIHTACIEPCLNDTSKSVTIKGESPTTGSTRLYGAGVFSYADTYIDKGLSIGGGVSLGVNGSKLIANKSSDLYGNTSVIGNLLVSTLGGGNLMTIRSGFRGATPTALTTTYDIAGGIGNHYFNDNVEVNNNLDVLGNINGSVINGSFVNLTGNLNVGGAGQSANISELYYRYTFKNNARLASRGSCVNGPSLASGGVLQINGLTGQATGSTILSSEVMTFGNFTIQKIVRFTFCLRLTSAITLGATSRFVLQSSTASTFLTPVNRSVQYVAGSYVVDETMTVNMMSIIVPTEPFTRIVYIGSTINFTTGTAPGFESYIILDELVAG